MGLEGISLDKEHCMFYCSYHQQERIPVTKPPRTFESRQAAEILGIAERKLRYWATIKAICPYQDSTKPGVRRLYTFENLLEAAVLRELDVQGVTIGIAARGLEKLRLRGFGKGSDCLLHIIGRERIEVVVVDDLEEAYSQVSQKEGWEDRFISVLNFLDQETQEIVREKEEKDRMMAFYFSFAAVAIGLVHQKEAVLTLSIRPLWEEIKEKTEE